MTELNIFKIKKKRKTQKYTNLTAKPTRRFVKIIVTSTTNAKNIKCDVTGN